METLKLKELAPYLPFKLKVIWCDGKIDTINPLLSEKNNVENEVSLQLALFAFEKEHIDLKPIFYPLDYLTKPITHNGEAFMPLDKLNELFGYREVELTHYANAGIGWNISSPFSSTAITFDDMYLPIQMLFEWHFDVFNLIPRGLAVPITEEFNPYK